MENPLRLGDKRLAAVYCLLNVVTGEKYVGSSSHLSRRFYNHRGQLRRGVNRHPLLQEAWKAHGEAAFEFVILEVIKDPNELLAAEQQWMHRLRPEYNVNVLAYSGRGVTRSSAVCLKISRSRIGLKPSKSSIAKMLATKKARGVPMGRAPGWIATPEYKERMRQATAHLRGEGNPQSKLTEADVREIKRRLREGEVQQRIADDFGIPQPRVSHIKLGKSWGHVT